MDLKCSRRAPYEPICRRTCGARNSRNAAPGQNHEMISHRADSFYIAGQIIESEFPRWKYYPCEQLQAALVFAER
jgi:hypothetical protein